MTYRSTSLARANRVRLPGSGPESELAILERRIEALVAEREALKAELALAQAWVRELAHLVEAGARPKAKGRVRSFAAAMREECGLCGHTRMWHHLHLVPWGRE